MYSSDFNLMGKVYWLTVEDLCISRSWWSVQVLPHGSVMIGLIVLKLMSHTCYLSMTQQL